MKKNFNELFSGYPAGVYPIIKKAIQNYCKRPANKKRFEEIILSQRFEMIGSDFRVLGKKRFHFLFKVMAYEFFADEFIPKYVIILSSNENGEGAGVSISSRVYNYDDED